LLRSKLIAEIRSRIASMTALSYKFDSAIIGRLTHDHDDLGRG
jgi:hypothetical protein